MPVPHVRDEATVEASMVEGLFVRALKAGPELKADLRTIGVDLERMEPRYTPRQWHEAIELARTREYSAVPQEQGLRMLGRRFFEGFADTLIGKVLVAGFSIMGPLGILKFAPRGIRAARPDTEVIVTNEASRVWTLELRQPYPQPDFTAGLVEAAGKRAGATFQVLVSRRQPAAFELRITW